MHILLVLTARQQDRVESATSTQWNKETRCSVFQARSQELLYVDSGLTEPRAYSVSAVFAERGPTAGLRGAAAPIGTR